MIKSKLTDALKTKVRQRKESIAVKRDIWIKRNSYYYKQLVRTLSFVIDKDSRVLHINCSTGYILNKLNVAMGVGIDDTEEQIKLARMNYPHLVFYNSSLDDISIEEKFDYILISHLEDVVDIKALLDSIKKNCIPKTRLITVSYNFFWEPFVKLAELLGLKFTQGLTNWLTVRDVVNFLNLSGYERLLTRRIVLLPWNIPLLSYIANRFISRLPLINGFTLTNVSIARPLMEANKEFSVSIVVPCKNEVGNIEDAVKRIPDIGSYTEIIFCDDKSTDGTSDKVREMIEKYPQKNIRLVDGPGVCKAENVWAGFDAAKCEILLIMDADLSVIPEELPYFYEAISKGYGEFINGSRMIYPMQNEAMRFLNAIGNKLFSIMFSYILDTPIKDTLCGTKAMWKDDFQRIKKLRGSWGVQDRWGDYELIYGASKIHLKIIDLPIHYANRTYGETKMTNRLANSWIMFRMCLKALLKIKFH